MPGWNRSSTFHRLPKGWSATVRRILERDGYSCQWVRTDTGRKCGLPAREVDHRVPRFEGGSHDDSNLWALCPYHHGRKTADEAARSARRNREKRQREALTQDVGVRFD